MVRGAVLISVVAGGVACSSASDEPSGRGAADAGKPAILQPSSDAGADAAGTAPWARALGEPLDWQPCRLQTLAEPGTAPSADAGPGGGDVTDWALYDRDAECATTRMPLYHREVGGETIPYFVKRVRATAPRRGQVWLLAGGPGSPGIGVEYMAWLVGENLKDLDIYLPDHRGTGQSSELDCEITKSRAIGRAPVASCAREIMGSGTPLDAYRTTEASFDVLNLIDATREGDEPVFVIGESYGGYWAHRILAIAPDVVTAAVLDGAARIVGFEQVTDDIDARDAAGRRLLVLCAADPDCAGHLDTLDFDTWRDRINALPTTCPDLDRPKGALTAALESFNLKRLVPAALGHLASCSAEDLSWFQAFAREAARRAGGGLPDYFADGLYINVAFSEVLGRPLPQSTFDERARQSLFGTGVANPDFNDLLTWYPEYPPDEYSGKVAEPVRDVLIVHGDLDPRVNVDSAVEARDTLGLPDERFVRFPTGGHVVMFSSHDYDKPVSCGAHVVFRFLEDPTAPIDRTCVDETPPIGFDGDPDLVSSLFGTVTSWDVPVAMP